MFFDINDKERLFKYQRVATAINIALVILVATFSGVIADWVLKMYFDITPLGVWAVFAVAGSVMTGATRLYFMAMAIAMGEATVTVHDQQGQRYTQQVKQNNTSGDNFARVMESFRPVTYVFSVGIIVSISILVTEHHSDAATQLIPAWVKFCPITIAACAYATSISLTSTKNLELLLGQGIARSLAVKVGKTFLIATGIGFLLVIIAGPVALFSMIR